MSKEELLMQRYKVIAEYPGGNYKIGDFVQPHAYYGFDIFPYPEKYPHLFKPLQWWEEREEKDMPRYVKCISGVDSGRHYTVADSSQNGRRWHVDNEIEFSHLLRFGNSYIPTTKSEYNEYISKK